MIGADFLNVTYFPTLELKNLTSYTPGSVGLKMTESFPFVYIDLMYSLFFASCLNRPIQSKDDSGSEKMSQVATITLFPSNTASTMSVSIVSVSFVIYFRC